MRILKVLKRPRLLSFRSKKITAIPATIKNEMAKKSISRMKEDIITSLQDNLTKMITISY